MPPHDFDIDGLAAYLHLTPSQVERMASRGKLPGRRIAGQWRFPEAEIHHWLEDRIGVSDDQDLAHMEHLLQKGASQADDVRIAGLLPVAAIAIPLQARTRQSVITNMVEVAAQTGWLWDPDKMVNAVRAREDLQSTALENGLALLHPRRPQQGILERPFVAFGRTGTGIPFGAPHGGLTDLFFLICSIDDRQHLRTLARLCRLLGDSELLDAMRQAADAIAFRDLVEDYEQRFFD